MKARWMRTAISGAVATLLAGCGNEHLLVGQWQEVGQAVSPICQSVASSTTSSRD
jgi:hypothetical protein